ncbi:MAG: hypothetical protein M2R45_04334 [Verrucomicrobia subdivision 3 bacterium]|nr:hypothetical protein [Limisphaerales bacterium]MCS1416038.1 hypothetical protein [Limisphaerales bacterium]
MTEGHKLMVAVGEFIARRKLRLSVGWTLSRGKRFAVRLGAKNSKWFGICRHIEAVEGIVRHVIERRVLFSPRSIVQRRRIKRLLPTVSTRL